MVLSSLLCEFPLNSSQLGPGSLTFPWCLGPSSDYLQFLITPWYIFLFNFQILCTSLTSLPVPDTVTLISSLSFVLPWFSSPSTSTQSYSFPLNAIIYYYYYYCCCCLFEYMCTLCVDACTHYMEVKWGHSSPLSLSVYSFEAESLPVPGPGILSARRETGNTHLPVSTSIFDLVLRKGRVARASLFTNLYLCVFF